MGSKAAALPPTRLFQTRAGAVTLIPSCPVQVLETLGIDAGLGFFWHNRPDLQRAALLKIAAQPQGHVTIAHNEARSIVGYVTITLPDEDTRWGRDHIEGLDELGGIEVSRAWRGLGLSAALMKATFAGGAFDQSIVIATGYRWCWDVEPTGLTVREYRDMLYRVFLRYGFEFFETDEPNIAWYPDNALVARVGQRVPVQLLARFKALLFERLGSDYASSEFLR
ncbi:MAG: N-acetyltransferase [Chloroflexota bacterium]|nr:N-acetyltransferase [Chloroflexota bacterium]